MKKTARLLALLMALALVFTCAPVLTVSAADAPLEFTFMGKTRPPYDPEMMDIWNELMARTNTKINFM
ncbi:MAG: hypothetical protein RR482_06040, partial [Clostridia bacterium]